MDRKIISPCIGVCTLEDDICKGCGRTIEEIKEAYEWQQRKNHQGRQNQKMQNYMHQLKQKLKENLRYIHQRMQMPGLLEPTKKEVVLINGVQRRFT